MVRNAGEETADSQLHTVKCSEIPFTVLCTIPRKALIDTEFHYFLFCFYTTKRQQTLRNN